MQKVFSSVNFRFYFELIKPFSFLCSLFPRILIADSAKRKKNHKTKQTTFNSNVQTAGLQRSGRLRVEPFSACHFRFLRSKFQTPTGTTAPNQINSIEPCVLRVCLCVCVRARPACVCLNVTQIRHLRVRELSVTLRPSTSSFRGRTMSL